MAGAVNPRVAALIYGGGAELAQPDLTSLIQRQEVAPAAVVATPLRPGDPSFVASVDDALRELPAEIDWVWLLEADVEVAADTLAQLLGRVEVSPSAGMVGAKQLQQRDRSKIASLGMSISQLAEPVRLSSGEFDQGQHDADSDVLAVDLNCSLVLREAMRVELKSLAETPSDALALELGMRLRAAGRRVLVEPAARCWVAGASGDSSLGREFKRLIARIHLAILVLPILWVFALWLAAPLLVPVALVAAFIRKLPSQAITVPAAIAWGWVTLPKRLSARASLRSIGDIAGQRAFWFGRSALRKLRMVNLSQAAVFVEPRIRLVQSGVIWWISLPLLASYQLFSFAVPRSADLPPISDSLVELVRTAFTPIQPYWDGVVANSEPSSWFWLTFGLLSPAEPGLALGWLIFLAPALAYLITAKLLAEVTASRTVLILLAMSYALNPLLITTLLHGNAALAALQLLIPLGALAARRVWLQSREQSWSWWAGAGLATFLLAALYPLLAGIWSVGFLIAIVARHPKKTSAALLSFAPTLLLLTFHGIDLLNAGAVWLILLPTTPDTPAVSFWWLLPLALILLIWGLGIERISLAELLTAALLLSAAACWFWLVTLAQLLLAAALLSALVAIAGRTALQSQTDSIATSRRWAPRVLISLLTASSLLGGYGLVTQPPQFQQGSSALMPALVSATADIDPQVRTLVIESTGDRSSAQLIWNDGRHLDEVSLRLELLGTQYQAETKQQTARLVASLLAGNSQVALPALESLKVAYILVVSPTPEVTRGLSTISGLASSGLTEFGELWRNTEYEAAAAAAVYPNLAQWVILVMVAILALLAIPKPRIGRRSSAESPIFDEVTD